MVLLIHQNGEIIDEALKGGQKVELSSTGCVPAFWEVGVKFPEELICWVEKSLLIDLNIGKLEEIFTHDLIMASYAVKSKFLPESIGYIDQLPFINVDSGVRYPTWRMSSDVGAIKAKTLLRFKELFSSETSFDGLLNSIAKLGQQNGLFCYSDPALLKLTDPASPEPTATPRQLFGFVKQHYKSIWVFVLFWCLWHYERRFCLWPLFISLFERKYFKKQIDLPEIKMPDEVDTSHESIDVLIPTIGRPHHLLQVVQDLREQALLPKRVIIIEQNPDPDSVSDLEDLKVQEWPFEIIHHFTHKTGACMARNMGLREINSKWMFLCDDDNRIIHKDFLYNCVKVTSQFKAAAINTLYRQRNEKMIFQNIKQWGAFGAGNTFLESQHLKGLNFNEIYEYGYSEDLDFGMQLRKKGVDIIYYPWLELLHLKAPIGGFREKSELKWDQDKIEAKPSPTVMVYALLYYSTEELRGFKVSLFLKYYGKQANKNPISYYSSMKERWKRSEYWAEKLIKENSENAVSV